HGNPPRPYSQETRPRMPGFAAHDGSKNGSVDYLRERPHRLELTSINLRPLNRSQRCFGNGCEVRSSRDLGSLLSSATAYIEGNLRHGWNCWRTARCCPMVCWTRPLERGAC